MVSRERRAARMAPEHRRAAIIAATLPLVLEHGTAVSTRLIAEAADIAEGTIYRVFPDKDALIAAVVAEAFDPEPTLRALAAIDRRQPLPDRLGAAVTIFQHRVASVFRLIGALGLTGPPSGPKNPVIMNDAFRAAVVDLIGPDHAHLRVAPAEFAHVLRLLVFSGTHPFIADGRPLGAEQIVAVLLDGMRTRHLIDHHTIDHHTIGGPSMLIRLLRTHLRPYSRYLWFVVALQVIGTVAALYLPSLNADIIDQGIARGDTPYILRTGGWMLAVTVVQVVVTIIATWYGARTAMGFGRDVRSAVFHRVGGFSAREVNRFGAPSLITRSTNDVQQVQMLVLMTCTMLVAAPIMCVGGVIMALREDVGLSWLMVVAVPLLVVAIGLVIARMVPKFRLMQVRIDAVNRILREQITGIRVVRAFVREPVETARFGRANTEVTDVATSAGRLQALIFPIVLLILNLSSVAALWFGAARIDAGEMQIGALTAFLAYLLQILMSVMMATFMAIMIPRASVCADRITEVLDTESSVGPPAPVVTPPSRRGELVFDGAGFRYPGAAAPVLRDVSFTASPGRTTAIIGSTGAGKTTLVSMVPRLFDATTGSVRVDGVDVREMEPETLWSRIGLVPQRPYLFSGTVASNLRYGDPGATDDELWAALRVAQGEEFVRAITEGLEAPISQGGTNVSGGQRQRLAIARALVRRPEIYLFDDSFSALDLTTDARLRAALRPVTANATVVIVAQRVSTIRDADQIVVLDDGAVVGIGRHDELLASCPTYVEIVESQLSAEVAA